jgi:hypothetical protein
VTSPLAEVENKTWYSLFLLKAFLTNNAFQKWAFPICEKLDQIKGTPLKYIAIFPSKIRLVNFFSYASIIKKIRIIALI